VSNLGVFDFGGEGHSMRLVSVHPGVALADVVAATAFPLAIDGDVPETRRPTDAELPPCWTSSIRGGHASGEVKS